MLRLNNEILFNPPALQWIRKRLLLFFVIFLLNPLYMNSSFNPVVYFEIPVTDMSRAVAFYKKVFGFSFTTQSIDAYEMAMFPFTDGLSGISGALAKGDVYQPSLKGVIVYFRTTDLDSTLERAVANGGNILYPKTDNGIGLVAEFQDSEGNRIALFQAGVATQ